MSGPKRRLYAAAAATLFKVRFLANLALIIRLIVFAAMCLMAGLVGLRKAGGARGVEYHEVLALVALGLGYDPYRFGICYVK